MDGVAQATGCRRSGPWAAQVTARRGRRPCPPRRPCLGSTEPAAPSDARAPVRSWRTRCRLCICLGLIRSASRGRSRRRRPRPVRPPRPAPPRLPAATATFSASARAAARASGRFTLRLSRRAPPRRLAPSRRGLTSRPLHAPARGSLPHHVRPLALFALEGVCVGARLREDLLRLALDRRGTSSAAAWPRPAAAVTFAASARAFVTIFFASRSACSRSSRSKASTSARAWAKICSASRSIFAARLLCLRGCDQDLVGLCICLRDDLLRLILCFAAALVIGRVRERGNAGRRTHDQSSIAGSACFTRFYSRPRRFGRLRRARPRGWRPPLAAPARGACPAP